MEHENNTNGRGLATAALATAIPTAAVEFLNWIGNGALRNITGNGNACHPEERPISAREAAMMSEIAELKTEKKLLESNIYSDQKDLALYDEIAKLKEQINAQAVYNATNTGAINCINAQIAQLMSLTKVIIPATSICPNPMPQYNSWVAPSAPSGT